jgi:hypothetical protein
MAMALPAAVAAYRDRYRAEQIGPRYSGRLHFGFTCGASLAVIAVALAGLRALQPLELLAVPATFLFANFVEWRGHKGPMHHRLRVLSLMFQRHTLEHHRFFTGEAMSWASLRDLKMVLFPPVMLVFFVGLVATPVGILLFLVASRNVALLYVATAMTYLLTYECLHLCHHLPEDSWAGRNPLLRRLRAHHRTHHDPMLMGAWNFNITFPICDRLFRTSYPAPRSEQP